jgi:2-polyprenyl-3-methyl-5-hydroxy-6-metoxy-1,4-benzoquinol methylase
LDLPKDIKILDLGCGTGSFLKDIIALGYTNVYGADMAPEDFMLPKVKFVKANFNEKFPFKDNEFDIVFSLEVIEHLENPWHYMDEMQRIIKSKGYLIMTTPNPDTLASRFMFLLKGRFIHFGGGGLSYEKNTKTPLVDKHRTPIFHFLFKEMIYTKFRIISFKGNGISPLIKGKELHLPTKNPLFGMNKIYCLKKI